MYYSNNLLLMIHRNRSRACGNVEKMLRTLRAPVIVGRESAGAGTYGGRG
jgi:hypothetical protein